MRINRLEELQKIHLDIKDKVSLDNSMDIQKNEAMLLKAIKDILSLSNIARLEGLLALEETVQNISIQSAEEELKQLIILIVDGTEPDVIAGIGLARYYASLYKDYFALRYFIYLEGVLSIQAGDNPRVLEEKLKVMLPPKMYLEYSIEQEQKRVERETTKQENLIENLCKGERFWNPGENGYYVSKLVDYVICDITNKELQSIIKNVDNEDLALAMKGMSGEARRHIFENLSERLAREIAENMTCRGPVRVVDILEAAQNILSELLRLVDNGEIIGKYEYLEPFYNVFHVDTKSERQKNSKISQLKEMVEEYEKDAELVR